MSHVPSIIPWFWKETKKGTTTPNYDQKEYGTNKPLIAPITIGALGSTPNDL